MCEILEVFLVWGFIKLQLNKVSATAEDFLFKKSTLFYYQSTMIFPKTFCDRSDSLPFNNMTLHWFLQLRDVQGSGADVSYPVISQLWTVLACKHLFPPGRASGGILTGTALRYVLLAPFRMCASGIPLSSRSFYASS